MNILNYDEYNEYKLNFIKNHKSDYVMTTYPMDEYGEYFKRV